MPTTANSKNWRVRYPRRSPHPPHRRIRLEVVDRAAAAGSDRALGIGTPKTLGEKSRPSASSRQHPHQVEKRNMDGAATIVYNGAEDTAAAVVVRGDETGRAVRFDPVVKLILVPTRSDLGWLSEHLWWGREDFLQFRLGAVVDASTEVLRRSLGQQHSRGRKAEDAHRPRYSRPFTKSTPTSEPLYGHPSEIVPALRVADHPRCGRSASQHLKIRLPSPVRVQPPTPPTSPANESGAEGGAKEIKKSFPPEEAVPLNGPAFTKGERSYIENFDGLVGLGGFPS